MALVDLIDAYSVDSLTYESLYTTESNDELSKDMFLQLLITQLEYQDPLDPISNEDMLAQLATFSSLEQMTAINEKMEQQLYLDTYSIAMDYMGKEAFWIDSDTETLMSGIIDYMEFAYDEPMLFVGDLGIPLSDIAAIQTPSTSLTLQDLQDFIGYEVSWMDDDEVEYSGVVEAVEVDEDGNPILTVDGEEISFGEIYKIAQPS